MRGFVFKERKNILTWVLSLFCNSPIYELKGNKGTFLEKRKTSKYSPGEPVHKFNSEKFEVVFNVIKDCKIVYTTKIGGIPAQKLKEKGINPIKYEGKIEGLFQKDC